ncbi:flavodoxin [Bhargavaea beijingensis]|uniref:flavodoxin n=1 Tax=Bhargavaea beijingensis TaxID=426756 RepID=UPI0021AD5035|nr:flavodoxin [Bhargavaea beijingensis]MCW1929258.1 flavodoxin [Bhargavaea beijingensis]
MRFLIAYATYSGNTKEAAELIADFLEKAGHAVEFHWIGGEPVPDVSEHDALILGSFTWAEGSVPEEVKDFILDVGHKPPNTFIFGTGDTQFGGDALFCRAAVKLARFYESPLPPLKIEQSPRGGQQEAVRVWTSQVAERAGRESGILLNARSAQHRCTPERSHQS